MPLWLLSVESLAVAIIATIVLLIVLVLRRRTLERSRGSFVLSVKRLPVVSPKGWRPGIAIYRDEELLWFSLFSLAWRPKYRLRRGQVDIDGRREPVGQEDLALPLGQVIVTAQTKVGIEQMALTPQSLTGLLAWLEASPPGHGISKVL